MTTATIQMWGNTRAVRIPKALAEQLALKAVRPRKRYKLSDLLAQCKGKNPSRELISGRAGKEKF